MLFKTRAVAAGFSALALVVGAGLPVLTGVVAPALTPRAAAADAGVAALHPVEYAHSTGAELSWDPFLPLTTGQAVTYEVHRSTTDDFTPSAATRLTTIADGEVTSWVDVSAKASTTYSYRVVANGAVSADQRVALPAAGSTTVTLEPIGSRGAATYVYNDTTTPAACSDRRNHGSAASMKVGTSATGEQYRSLLQFDMRRIPAAATVGSANLTLSYAGTSAGNFALSVHRALQPWREGTGTGACDGSGATWRQTQRGVDWGKAGGSFDSAAVATIAAKDRTAAGSDTASLTALVGSWVAGRRANHGLVVKKTDDTPTATATSLDLVSDDAATKQPRLVVTYTDATNPVAPRAVVSSPREGDRVGGTVSVVAAAADDAGVASVAFLVGGVTQTTKTSPPWTWSWNTAGLSGGKALTVRATDTAGNVTTSAARNVVVDNSTAPTAQLTAPLANASVKGTAVSMTASATDDVGVTAVEFLVDDHVVARDTAAPWAATWNTLDINNPAYDGDHFVTVRSYDGGGKVTSSTPVKVVVTNTTATVYRATLALVENKPPFAAVEVPPTFLDNDLAPVADAWSGNTTTTQTLTSAPKDGTASYATYSDGSASSSSASKSSGPAGIEAQEEIGPKPTRDPSSIAPGSLWASVNVTNTSTTTWKGGTSGVQIWYRWYVPTESPAGDGSATDKGVVLFEGPATSWFPQTMQPGASRAIETVIEPPSLPQGLDKSRVRLRIDLYDPQTGTWFSSKGNKPIDQPVVVNRDLEGALGLERYWQYEGENTGAGSQTLTNVANGNVMWRWSPFFAPGRGLATMVDLTYNSLEDHSESPAGNNMSLSISGLTRFGYGLDIHPNRADEISGRGAKKYVTLTDGDGTTHVFDGETVNGTTTWKEPPGVNLYLRSVGGTDPAKVWALTRPDNTTYFFDAAGYPRSVVDRNGNTLTFTLATVQPGEDPGGPKMRITEVVDAAGRKFTIDYWTKAEAKKAHVRGKIQSIADHTGSQLLFDYYDDGNLRKLTQVGGTKANGEPLADRSFVFTYTTSNGAGPAIPDPNLRIDPAAKTPNQSTRLFSIRDPRGKETAFAYYGPGSGQLRWKVKNRWNRRGNPAGACTSTNFCTDFGYNISTRVTTVTAPENRDTDFTYDVTGRVTRIVNPAEQATSVLWSADNKVSQVTEPGGAIQKWEYDHNGYLTKHTNAINAITTLAYTYRPVDANDTAGHWGVLKSRTSPRGNATATAGDHTWTFVSDAAGNTTSVTDPEDYVTRYDWNLAGSTAPGTVRTSTDARGYPTSYVYDASGQPSKITDPEGQVTTMGYDADGLLRWVKDPNHAGSPDPVLASPDRTASTWYDYDSFHRLGRQSAPKSTRFDLGKLIWSSAEFDENDNLVRRIDPHYGSAADDPENGSPSTGSYDAMDQIVEQSNQQGDRTGYQWDNAGRLVRVTKPKGVASTGVAEDFSSLYTYDDLDRVVRQSDFGVSAADVRRTHLCYDVPGDLRSVTSPRSGLASLTCPGSGPYTGSFTTSYTYDAAHRRLTSKDPLGHESRTTYDLNDNRTTTSQDVDRAGAPGRARSTTLTYDERDQPVKSEQKFSGTRVLTSLMRYDGNGNKILSVTPRGFDQANGAAISETSPFVTSYTYDKVNRMTRVAHPFGPNETERHYTHRSFDANGNLRWTSLPVTSASAGSVADTARTLMTYWDPGWIRTSDSPEDPTVRYDYAAQSWQVERVPDRKGQSGVADEERRMIWRFYADGQLKERRASDGEPSTYTYDANNNLLTGLDASGVTGPDDDPMETVASYTGFDEVRRVWHRKRTDAGDGPWKFSDYTYDANGNVTRRLENGKENSARSAVTEAPDEHLLTYDQADWLTEQLALNETNLDLTRAAACKDDQRIVNSFFDTGWEKKRDVHRAGTGCSATASSWPLKQTTTWTHFDNGKLNQLRTTNGQGDLISSHDVGYFEGQRYEDGNRTTDQFVAKQADGQTKCTTAGEQCIAKFTYDARLRLVRHDRGTGQVDTYALDEPAKLIDDTTIRAGNVTTKQEGSDPAVSQRYRGTQLSEISVSAGGATATASYVYDSYGNVDCVTNTAGSSSCPDGGGNLVQDYAYDELDRLASQKTYSGGNATDTADYTYDAFDRVTKEKETHGGTDRTTDFSFEGLTSNVTEEKQSGGSNPKTKTFSYDSYGHRISMSSTPNGSTQTDTFTYAYDVHGSVSQLVGDGGQVKASYGYDAYGGQDDQLSSSDGSLGETNTDPLNPYRFQGRRLDSGSAGATSEATSLDMGARRYGVDTGRFLQQDMYASALGDLGLALDPLSQNNYALAGGNPISFVEVDGHMVTADGSGGGTADPNPTDESGDGDSWLTNVTEEIDDLSKAADAVESGSSALLAASTAKANRALTGAAVGVADNLDDLMDRVPLLNKYADATEDAIRSGVSRADDWLRQNRSSLQTAQKWSKRAGVAGAFVGTTLGLIDNHQQGMGVGENVARTGFELGGAAAGAALGAAAGAACGPAALVCGAVGGAVGGYIGGEVGGYVGDVVFSEDPLGKVTDDVGDVASDVGDAVTFWD